MMKNQRQSQEDLSQRLQRTLQLAEIPKSWTTEPANGQPGALLDRELATELQAVVDVLRQVLRAFITELSARSGRQPQEVLDWYKMELAVEMLRDRRARVLAPPSPEPESTYTFENLITHALTITAQHTRYS
jgi:hypothetical protein